MTPEETRVLLGCLVFGAVFVVGLLLWPRGKIGRMLAIVKFCTCFEIACATAAFYLDEPYRQALVGDAGRIVQLLAFVGLVVYLGRDVKGQTPD